MRGFFPLPSKFVSRSQLGEDNQVDEVDPFLGDSYAKHGDTLFGHPTDLG